MRFNLGNYLVPTETKGGLCFDIGGNFGDFTNKYANNFDEMYIIEPQINLYNRIVDLFKDKTHIKPLNRAVWSESNVELELVYHSNTDLGSVGIKSELLDNGWTNNVVNKIKSISLEEIYEIVDNKSIDYFKVDCETSEYYLLLNKDLSKLKYIGIELHHAMGSEKFKILTNWIKNTHDLINGNDNYTNGVNKEVLYKLK
jgi:FkbM family methyltransferase